MEKGEKADDKAEKVDGEKEAPQTDDDGRAPSEDSTLAYPLDLTPRDKEKKRNNSASDSTFEVDDPNIYVIMREAGLGPQEVALAYSLCGSVFLAIATAKEMRAIGREKLVHFDASNHRVPDDIDKKLSFSSVIKTEKKPDFFFPTSDYAHDYPSLSAPYEEKPPPRVSFSHEADPAIFDAPIAPSIATPLYDDSGAAAAAPDSTSGAAAGAAASAAAGAAEGGGGGASAGERAPTRTPPRASPQTPTIELAPTSGSAFCKLGGRCGSSSHGFQRQRRRETRRSAGGSSGSSKIGRTRSQSSLCISQTMRRRTVG